MKVTVQCVMYQTPCDIRKRRDDPYGKLKRGVRTDIQECSHSAPKNNAQNHIMHTLCEFHISVPRPTELATITIALRKRKCAILCPATRTIFLFDTIHASRRRMPISTPANTKTISRVNVGILIAGVFVTPRNEFSKPVVAGAAGTAGTTVAAGALGAAGAG